MGFESRLTALEDVSAVHKEVERVLLRELYALADDESELVGGEVTGRQVPEKQFKVCLEIAATRINLKLLFEMFNLNLLAPLVVWEVRLCSLLANDGNLVWILLNDLLGLLLALL